MHSEYNQVLVFLALLIGVATSYTALDLASRCNAASSGTARAAWLSGAAVSLGGGIWSMHFVAMLADKMPGMNVSYEPGLTVLSFLIAVSATGLGFFVVSLAQRQAPAVLASGLLMGVGIASMHYTGMAALQMPMSVSFDPFWVTVSVLIAVSAATAALWLAFHHQRQIGKFVAAIIMGAAIAGMHFAGMRAAIYMPTGVAVRAVGQRVDQETLALAVSMITFFTLALALMAAFVDRRFAAQSQSEAAEFRRSEERFRLLYRRTPLPLHAVDRTDRIIDVSDTWLSLLGLQREEVIRKPLREFMTVASAQRRANVTWPTLLAAGDVQQVEATLITKAGHTIDVEMTGRIERDDAGKFLSCFEGLIDITSRKAAESILRQAQKKETLGELTGGVAHQLNNLLAIILGNLELLKERVDADERSRHLIETAVQGVQRGATLTQQMFAFARRQSLSPKPVDVITLILGIAERQTVSLGANYKVVLPLTGTAVAYVDENQLEVALSNLIANARDAMPTGGEIRIRVETVKTETGGEQIAIEVNDQGVGMDEETLARATEPFFSTKGPTNGTGLGLSMVDGFAAQSGGRLQISSAPHIGTRATIFLPAADAFPSVVNKQTPSQALPRQLLMATVLAVDDDVLVLMNTQTMLEEMGHLVLTASNGEEALQILYKTREIDLIITDQAMPKMTGLQLASEVRISRPGLPVILATGYSDLPTDQPNIVSKLNKPYLQADLQKAVHGALGSVRVLPSTEP